MKSSEEHFENQQPSAGSLSDMKILQQNAAASVGELREFLGQLRGRSPQEVMGIVAQSSLVQGVVSATVGTLIILIVFTVGPYLLYGGANGEAQANLTGVTESAGEESPETMEEAAEPSGGSEQAAARSNEPDLERAAAAMGIDQTEDADPNQNPLDSRLDKLLDGIE